MASLPMIPSATLTGMRTCIRAGHRSMTDLERNDDNELDVRPLYPKGERIYVSHEVGVEVHDV